MTMGSRTRQTRAVVSYKLDSSSDDSDDDMGFTVPRSARNDSLRGSNNEEGEPGNCKGRRTLALKKKRGQDGGGARDVERVQRRLPKENSGIQQIGLSANLVPPTVPEDFESDDRKLHQETKAAAFQHLVEVAFEATDARNLDTIEDGGGSVEDGGQMQCSVAREESAHEPTEREKSNNLQADERELRIAVEKTVINGEEGSRDAEPSAFDALRQRPKESSKNNNQADSYDDDWLEEDVFNEGSSESASDFSCEDASDSDIDMERPAKKRQSTKPVSKKSQQAGPRATVAKDPRIKSSPADRKVSSNSGQKADMKKPVTKSVGRPRKIVSPSSTSGGGQVEVSGATARLPRLQPVKLRLKMASKEGSSDVSPGGSSGGVPVQLISANNVPHRRVLGLSRRCRPPPLHPYLGGT